MPSPFPGMDPYLEDANVWGPFHTLFVARITVHLNRLLPSHYMASAGERVYVVDTDRAIYPDTEVFERNDVPRSEAAATAVAYDPPLEILDEPVEVQENFVEIRTVRPDRRLITVIEVLSPSNKYSGPGHALYLAKQQECLTGPVNLLEIDLLRRGPHTVAAPFFQMRAIFGLFDYVVVLHRARAGRRYQAWPFRLPERIRRVRVPLTGNDADLVLDLQECFAHCYEEGVFDRAIDYRGEVPSPSLLPADAAWADALLRERGLRP